MLACHAPAVAGRREVSRPTCDCDRDSSHPHPDAALCRYDADRRSWTPVTVRGEVPSARHFHTCVGVGRRLIVFGGYDGARWTDDLYSFDTGALLVLRPRRLPGLPRPISVPPVAPAQQPPHSRPRLPSCPAPFPCPAQ